MTYYFYDLETSGRDARYQRIMQFAGQRTDENLQPIGEPFTTFVRLGDDVLPEPEAILLTGITPQQTIEEGISEAEFIKQFYEKVLQPDTCIVGYNNIRFDDEFLRFTFWRNLTDAYEWQWRDGRCRWDLLDVIRMTRALRPEGIVWPVTDGKPTNRLEELTQENNLQHDNAHDALSDVQATIAIARLLRSKQPKLFDYLQSLCNKRTVESLLQPVLSQPVVHTSGMISSDFLKTSIVLPVAQMPGRAGSYLVYDLREDPVEFAELDSKQLKERLFTKQIDLGERRRLPIKGIHTNKCPAIAPLGVLDDESWQTIQLDMTTIEKHTKFLRSHPEFIQRIVQAWGEADEPALGSGSSKSTTDPDGALYDGFIGDADKRSLKIFVDQSADVSSQPDFQDNRLRELAFRYRARNFSKTLNEEEHERWEAFRTQRLIKSGEIKRFAGELQRLATARTDAKSQTLLEDLQLYAESILPVHDAE